MSTSSRYHGFEIARCRYARTEYRPPSEELRPHKMATCLFLPLTTLPPLTLAPGHKASFLISQFPLSIPLKTDPLIQK